MTPRVARLLAGAILLTGALVAFLTRLSATFAAHPAQLVLLGLCAAVGVGLVVAGLRSRRSPTGRWRVAGRILLVLAAILVAGAVLWLRPFTATDAAQDALASGGGVTVSESATRIRMTPARPDGAALVFVPGARVDPRAYAALLRPLAQDGHPVVIVKPPLGIGLLARGAVADEARTAADAGAPAVVVGGHSLGGTSAALVAADEEAVDGVLFWASFPANDDLRGRRGLRVASVSGTEDGLATPQDIAESRKDLPASTSFTAVDGAVHADFGDYGEQRGDGERGVPREEAQRAIVEASLAFMDEIAGARAARPALP